MNLAHDFFGALTSEPVAEPIVAIFKSGNSAEYTMAVFHLLVSDPAIDCIYSNVTGEVLFAA